MTLGGTALSFGFSVSGKPQQKVVMGAFRELNTGAITQGNELVLEELKERSKKLYKIKYDMHNWSWLLDSNKSEVPPIVPRDKCLIRVTVGPTPDAAREEIGEYEAFPEGIVGQAQAVAALMENKAKETSHIQTGPPKSKRSKSGSQTHGLREVSVNPTSGLPVFSFIHTRNP